MNFLISGSPSPDHMATIRSIGGKKASHDIASQNSKVASISLLTNSPRSYGERMKFSGRKLAKNNKLKSTIKYKLDNIREVKKDPKKLVVVGI
jgi:hypothetical protein